jgi:hypothetical protein
MNLENARPVLVEWIDATSHDPWEPSSDVTFETHTITTVGYLVHEDEKVIGLALNIDKEGDAISCTMTIPRPVIIRMVDLCPKKILLIP